MLHEPVVPFTITTNHIRVQFSFYSVSWEQLPEHMLMSGCLHVHRTVNQELQVLVCSVQMRCFSLLDKHNHDLKLQGRAMKFQSDTTRPHAPISPAGLWASGLLTRVVLKTWASPENVVSLTSSGLTVHGTLWVYYLTYVSTVMTPSCHSALSGPSLVSSDDGKPSRVSLCLDLLCC